MGFVAFVIYMILSGIGYEVGQLSPAWADDIWILLAPAYVLVFVVSSVGWVQLLLNRGGLFK